MNKLMSNSVIASMSLLILASWLGACAEDDELAKGRADSGLVGLLLLGLLLLLSDTAEFQQTTNGT